MALGSDLFLSAVGDHGSQITRPAQIASTWTIVHTTPEAYDGDSDGAVITRPDNVASAGTQYVNAEGKGTSLVLMHRYDDGESSGTSPIVNVFGRSGDSDPWCRLKNKSDAIDATLTADFTNDVEDGTFAYTTPDPDDHVFDLLGCNQVLVAVKTQSTLDDAGGGTIGDILAKVI